MVAPYPQIAQPSPLASAGGFGQNISNWFQQNPALVWQLASGLAGGRNMQEGLSQAFGGAAQAQQFDKQNQSAEQKKKAFQAWLKEQQANGLKVSPATMAAVQTDPELASELFRRQLLPEVEKPTDDMREYRQAVQDGFTGTFMDYQIKLKEAGKQSTTVNLNDWKIPAGFKLKDETNPNAGLVPIPGGPGEQLPAENAARTGLAENFLKQAPELKKKLQAGEATGLVDQFKGYWIQSSDAAQVIRQMKSGTDALQRMLTGAGMPAAEAQQYADRYLPTYTDDAASASQKLDQLVIELETIQEKIMRGRGGAPKASGVPEGIDPDLWQYLTPEEQSRWPR